MRKSLKYSAGALPQTPPLTLWLLRVVRLGKQPRKSMAPPAKKTLGKYALDVFYIFPNLIVMDLILVQPILISMYRYVFQF